MTETRHFGVGDFFGWPDAQGETETCQYTYANGSICGKKAVKGNIVCWKHQNGDRED